MEADIEYNNLLDSLNALNEALARLTATFARATEVGIANVDMAVAMTEARMRSGDAEGR